MIPGLSEEGEHVLRRFFSRWYRQNGRDFPWRADGVSPFGIVLVEMLLRQTRAEMVAEIWPGLVANYPDPESIVRAGDKELFDRLAYLGLGWQRVEALKAMAGALIEDHDGHVPRSVEQLLALPHLGLYSAHAVACFAFGRRVPVVDSNVLRVLSRLTDENFPRDNRRSKAQGAWDLAARIMPSRNARHHNYGLLDFAAQVCKPRTPVCGSCPLTGYCCYYQRLQDLGR